MLCKMLATVIMIFDKSCFNNWQSAFEYMHSTGRRHTKNMPNTKSMSSFSSCVDTFQTELHDFHQTMSGSWSSILDLDQVLSPGPGLEPGPGPGPGPGPSPGPGTYRKIHYTNNMLAPICTSRRPLFHDLGMGQIRAGNWRSRLPASSTAGA